MYVDFQKVNDSLDLRDVARYFGFDSKSEKTRCISPNHADKTPSMQLYHDHFHCFGCGEHGDAVHFTSVLFGISQYNAALRLIRIFGLNAVKNKDIPTAKYTVPRKNLYTEQEEIIREGGKLIFGYWKYLEYCNNNYLPKIAGDKLHPLFIEALNNMELFKYYNEFLLDCSREQQLYFFEKNKNMLEKIAPKVKAFNELKELHRKLKIVSTLTKDPLLQIKSTNFTEENVMENQHPAVYMNTYKGAYANGESELYAESSRLNKECAAAIDTAIEATQKNLGMAGANTYDLKTALADVTEKYGAKRVFAVVAHCINYCDSACDGRISQQNTEWARNINVPAEDYIPFETHRAVYDGFADKVRESHVKWLEMAVESNRDNQKLPTDWGDLIGEKFNLKGENEKFQMYKILEVNEDGSVMIERDDSWTFRAVGLKLENEQIHWDYSTNGQYTDEKRLQQLLEGQKNPEKLKHNSENITVDEYDGTWYVADWYYDSDIEENVFCLEHEDFGDETESIIVDVNGKFLVGEVYDNWLEHYENYKENLHYKELPKTAEINITEENPMENAVENNAKSAVNIRASAYLLESAGNLKANVVVSVNDTLVVRNVKVVETENGLSVRMPSKKIGGEWKDTVAPASKEAYAEIKSVVLDSYHNAVELAKNGVEQAKPELNPTDIQVEVWSLRDSTANNADIATCSVKIAETFVINDVKIREGGDLGLKVVLPGEYGNDGKWHDTVNVYDSVVRDTVLEKYVAREENKENIIGNTEYGKLAPNHEDMRYRSYTGELADKIIAALNQSEIPWSGKLDLEKGGVRISYHVKDHDALQDVVKKVKSPSKEQVSDLKKRLEAATKSATDYNNNRTSAKGQPGKKNDEVGD